MAMYSHQSTLPKLPIPPLEDTCRRYLAAVTPLLSPEQLGKTQQVVETFLTKEGPQLQAQLVAYARDKASYIEEFWNEAYLMSDASVVLNVNPFFVLADDPTPHAVMPSSPQISRAASLTISALHFYAKLRREALDVDTWRGKPLCMEQYRTLFGCARVPTDHDDRIESFPASRHIVVMSKGLLYYFDVLWDDGEVCLSEAHLCDNFGRILRDAAAHNEKLSADDMLLSSIGVLTTEARPRWAAAREQLARTPANASTLRTVDSALFVLCLDDDKPDTGDDIARTMLHGQYRLRDGVQCGSMTNRWYDKLQVIVCANGVAGVNFEHTRTDGHTVLRFVSDVFAETIMRFASKITTGVDPKLQADGHGRRLVRQDTTGLRAGRGEPDTWPRRISWDVERGSRLRQHIRFAEVLLSDLVQQHDTRTLEFDAFGKLAVTRLKASPDAFVQLALMAALYCLYGQVPCVYEPVQTKAFLHGRTEAARTMSDPAAKFVRVWASDVGDDVKASALRDALESIVELVKAASVGHGVDRHLYALRQLWQRSAAGTDARVPAIFEDEGWRALNHTVLSTSNCGNPALRLFGFGPVVPDGFGVGYIIKEQALSFCASSKHRQTARFLRTLGETLHGMRDVLARVAKRRRGAEAESHGYGFFDGVEDADPPPEGLVRDNSSGFFALGPRRDSDADAIRDRVGHRVSP